MPVTETFRIPKHRSHVPTSRQRVCKTLADWGITGELADTVTLLANELVTNAVTHCRVPCARVQIALALDGPELVLEVSDPDKDRLPRPHDSAPDEESGRGLALVAALADSWGHRQGPYSKCVWARFTLADDLAGARVPAGS
ncbi:anti-sigma regulatory factor (Ser/Thr protein kinase) [Streptomyces aurantiacus]|uniref:ATP-binding protein n=1 Tax=Streptomyces aurantiacus TaxID=47760 RepID=UPI00278F25F5|nr:ATP-binding protein [Streptomyces aurantiacus]MDQ0775436.1 anti-sigma regulatory factor (Ser/Thr protein kinase) [Streptomyces aurantiacus]